MLPRPPKTSQPLLTWTSPSLSGQYSLHGGVGLQKQEE